MILALWTLFFLGALALAVGAYVSAGLKLAGRLKTDSIAYYLARAGIEKAIMETLCDTNVWDGLCNDEDLFKDISMGGGSFTVSYTYTLASGQTITNCGIIGEEGKINVNEANRALLESLIRTAGGVDSMTALEISFAILDWRDRDDDVTLTVGAESSYYEGLNQPYACHNDNFDSLHELLLVKGMKQDLFSKLERHLTIFGTGKININTADATILSCLADACGEERAVGESLVTKIIRFRDAGNVFTKPSASAIVGQLNGFVALETDETGLLKKMMRHVTLSSTCFRGVAGGRVNGCETEGSRIDFVFDNHGTKLYWREM